MGRESMHRNKVWFLAMVAIISLITVRIWMADTIPVTDATEARYAEISRKMVETADWITPQYDYSVPFWGKPPLAFWISAAGIELMGPTELAARLGIFLLAVALSALFFLWLRRILDTVSAASAMLMMFSSSLYFVSAAAVMTDLVLAATVALGLIAFWQHFHHGSRFWELAFYCAIGLGLLAKGPIAVIFILFPIVMWAIITRKFLAAWRQFSWVKGALIAILIAAPWYFLAENKTPGFLEYFIVGEHLKRFLVSGWHGDLYGHAHSSPAGMIWLYWVGALFPWSLVLIPVVYLRRESLLENWRRHQHLILFGLLWTVCPLLLFTFAHNILWTYPLPGLPGAIVLLVALLAGKDESDNAQFLKFVSIVATLTAFLFAGVSVYIAKGTVIYMAHSQKQVVAEIEQRCNGADCGIYYWDNRFYSAEFYSQGRAKRINNPEQLRQLIAKRIDNPEQLRQLITNQHKDFLVVAKDDFSAIPADIRQHFNPVKQFGEILVLEEVEVTGEPSNHARQGHP